VRYTGPRTTPAGLLSPSAGAGRRSQSLQLVADMKQICFKDTSQLESTQNPTALSLMPPVFKDLSKLLTSNVNLLYVQSQRVSHSPRGTLSQKLSESLSVEFSITGKKSRLTSIARSDPPPGETHSYHFHFVCEVHLLRDPFSSERAIYLPILWLHKSLPQTMPWLFSEQSHPSV
jgi:hypothetical protein